MNRTVRYLLLLILAACVTSCNFTVGYLSFRDAEEKSASVIINGSDEIYNNNGQMPTISVDF